MLDRFYNCESVLAHYYTVWCATGHLCANGQCLFDSQIGKVTDRQTVPKRVFSESFFTVLSKLLKFIDLTYGWSRD